MKLQCPNPKCKYNFFDFDEHFLCCPRCAEIIQGNFQALNDRQRPLAYVKIKAFQDYVRTSKLMQTILFSSVFVLMGLELLLVFFIILSPNTISFPSFDADPSSLWLSSLYRRAFFIALIYFTHSHYEQTKFLQLALGPKIWRFHTHRGKVGIVINLIIVVLLMLFIEIPRFYVQYKSRLGAAYGSVLIPNIQTVFYVLYLIWVVAEVLVYHWDDAKRRNMCEAMSAL